MLCWRRLLGDLLDQSAYPLLLLFLGYSQQQEVLGRGHVIVHWCFVKRSMISDYLTNNSNSSENEHFFYLTAAPTK